VAPVGEASKVVVEIFCSYAHQDESLRRELAALLEPLKRKELIELWHDRRIEAGQPFADAIDDHLNTADIVVLMVSRHFLASDYSCSREVPRALERAQQGRVRVVPLIARACDWSDEPFCNLQAIPTDGKAVESWPNRDEAWQDVSVHIKTAVKTILQERLQQQAAAKAQLAELAAKREAEFRTDAQLAREIYAQVARDAEKQRLERQRIMQDLQARILALDEDVARRVAKKSAKNAFQRYR
jgi:uncharacterized protein YgiM (DUF1202 family)